MKTPISPPLAALAAACLAACGGEHGACEPVFVIPGPWCITVTGTANTCARPVPPPYEVVFTQASDALLATSGGVTYTGSLCASTGAMTGNDPAMTTTITITFAGDPAAIASGVSNWSGGGCSGTDTFTALPGACP
jgi:hypothetical protein